MLISYVEVEAKDVIMVHLSEEAVVDSNYKLISNFNIVDNHSNVLAIRSILVPTTDTASYIRIYVRNMLENRPYSITISNVISRSGVAITSSPSTFTYVKTKIDALVSSIPTVYDTSAESLVRTVLTAVGKEDNIIGGVVYGANEDD